MNIKTAQHNLAPIEGQFIGFLPDSKGKLKYIKVRVGEKTIPIKLEKEIRTTLVRELVKGDRLSISLQTKSRGNIKQLKLKTNNVKKIDSQGNFSTFELTSSRQKKKRSGKVLLCHKSSCVKRGGKQLYRALIENLKQLGLQEKVKIELTGCQKQCKQAPSLILMPGKVKHTYVHPQDLAALLQTHYL